MKSNKSSIFSAWIFLGMLFWGVALHAAEPKPSAREMEQKFIAVLKSDAAGGEKALACKQLAIYGSAEAVPVLAPLLANEELASWARIGLEVIPGPAADEALRQAMGQLNGRLLVGVINSIGVRRDAKAIDGLVLKLKDSDAQVATAAAVAIGRIGGDPAAKALTQALKTAPALVRPGVAEGSIRCAERFLVEGQESKAAKFYDIIRKADVPKQKALEATRGAILARKSKGVPLLVEQLRSPDKGYFGIGLRTARELPGAEATKALAEELKRASAQRQPMLLLALADRSDATAMPTLLEAAQNGPKELRITALGVLERSETREGIPTLLQAATDTDREVAQAAMGTLQRLAGKGVDADLLARLGNSTGKTRQVLIGLAAARGMMEAIPTVAACAGDPDAGIRRAALETLSLIGEDAQAGELVGLLSKTTNAADREETGKALLAICSRRGTGCLPYVLPLAESSDKALRITALDALASIGGPEALKLVVAGVNDRDEAVQDHAVRILSTWPNTWPDDGNVSDPLLTVARSGRKASHQVLAVQGYLQHVQVDKKLNSQEKEAQLTLLLPLIKRPEEKRSAVAQLERIPTEGSLKLLVEMTSDATVTGEACAAILSSVAREKTPVPKEERQKALQAVLEKSTDEATRKKAETALTKL